MTVAESALNVACAGARPVALVNCLNFGNPEHPEVMWQLSESIDGMAEACRALDIPVIGGNVSLYNDSAGADIDPTPVVAVLGVIDRLDRRPAGHGVLGRLDARAPRRHRSRRWRVALGRRAPRAPRRDAARPRPRRPRAGSSRWWRDVGARSTACSPRCTTSRAAGSPSPSPRARCGPGVGCSVDGVAGPAELFSESPSRVVLGTPRPDEVLARAQAAGVPARVLGTAGGDRIVVAGLLDLAVAEAAEAWRVALPGALGEPVTA